MTNRADFRPRIALSLVAGCLAGFWAYRHTVAGGLRARDFSQVWFAARALLRGVDPYPLVGPGRALEFPYGLLYPLPAAVAAFPVAPLSAPWANSAFIAIGVALFTWAITAYGWEPAVGLASASVLFAVETGQWSPILAASIVLAPVGVLLICKPTIGAAMFLTRPSRWPVIGAIVLLAVSFLILPHWLTSWRSAAAMRSTFTAPVHFPGGVFVLLAITRWRRPEARLLVALACVPQTTLLYETVPLFLIPRTIREAFVLTVASYGVAYWTVRYGGAETYAEELAVSGRAITLALYLPCTLMVLRRPNKGAVMSPWLLRWLSRVHQRFIFQRRVRVLSRHIAEMIPADARSVLDVGCGDGTLAELVMEIRPELGITGLELARRPTTAIPVEIFDGVTIPRPDRSVDVVLFVDVLHHADDVYSLLRESRRVARSAVIVKDHYADPWLGYLRLWWMDWAGNAAHGVSLRTVYGKRAWWEKTFSHVRLLPDESRTRLSLYPLPIRWLFESGLHFISRLTPVHA